MYVCMSICMSVCMCRWQWVPDLPYFVCLFEMLLIQSAFQLRLQSLSKICKKMEIVKRSCLICFSYSLLFNDVSKIWARFVKFVEIVKCSFLICFSYSLLFNDVYKVWARLVKIMDFIKFVFTLFVKIIEKLINFTSLTFCVQSR